MSDPGYCPYEPQSQLLSVADDLWIVDGPEIGYRFAGLTLPCPTRMTVVRIGSDLWLHSPTSISTALKEQLDALGTVTWLIAPNSFHYSHIAAWAAAYPAAECHVSPDLMPRFIDLPRSALPLEEAPPVRWGSVLDQRQVDLGSFTETIFFHRPSATLIVTDLLQNFEADRVVNPVMRLILKVGGSIGPAGTTSIDIRLPAWRQRSRLRAVLEQLIAWGPRRIILSHGKCYDADIEAELRRAFRWAVG